MPLCLYNSIKWDVIQRWFGLILFFFYFDRARGYLFSDPGIFIPPPAPLLGKTVSLNLLCTWHTQTDWSIITDYLLSGFAQQQERIVSLMLLKHRKVNIVYFFRRLKTYPCKGIEGGWFSILFQKLGFSQIFFWDNLDTKEYKYVRSVYTERNLSAKLYCRIDFPCRSWICLIAGKYYPPKWIDYSPASENKLNNSQPIILKGKNAN